MHHYKRLVQSIANWGRYGPTIKDNKAYAQSAVAMWFTFPRNVLSVFTVVAVLW